MSTTFTSFPAHLLPLPSLLMFLFTPSQIHEVFFKYFCYTHPSYTHAYNIVCSVHFMLIVDIWL